MVLSLGQARRRRDCIKGIVGSATAWPLAARAQQGEHIRRIGALMNSATDDSEAPALVGTFSQGLAESGWIIGRNVRIDYRWYHGKAEAAPRRLLLILPGVVDVELSPRHKDRTGAIAGNGEPMLLQIPAS